MSRLGDRLRALAPRGAARYLGNTGWMMAEKVLRLTVNLLVGTVWVARHLGPDGFGVLNYVQSYVWMFAALAGLGMNEVLVRELVLRPERREEIMGTAMRLRLAGGAGAMALVAASLLWVEQPPLVEALVVLVSSSLLLQPLLSVESELQARVEAKHATYAYSASMLGASLLKVALIVLDAPLAWFVGTLLVEQVLLAGGFAWIYRARLGRFSRTRFSAEQARLMLRTSVPMMLSGAFISVYMKIDQLMLMEMLGKVEVGRYAAAVRLSEAWYFVPAVLANSLFPAIIATRAKDLGLYERRMLRLYDLLYWMSLGVAVAMGLAADWLVPWLYGPGYEGAAAVLRIHVWAGVFTALGVARGKWIVAEDLTRFTLYYISIGAVVNVALNWLLIPTSGIIGASWATLAAYAVAGYLAPALFRPTRPSFVMISKSLFFIGLRQRWNILSSRQ